MGAENHGMRAGQALDELSDFNDLLGVKADRRLVEDQDRGIVQ